jgi:hypothetical protein
MGYFSNASEADCYRETHCVNCAHQGAPDETVCPVWMAHLIFNYDECNNERSILHSLIPRRIDGPGNELCTMFFSKEALQCQSAR